MIRQVGSFAAMLTLLVTLGVQATASDEEKKEEKKQQVVTVRVEKADATAEAQADGQVKVQAIVVGAPDAADREKKQIHVRAIRIGGDDAAEGANEEFHAYAIAVGAEELDIEKALKEAGLKGEQLEKVKAAVEKAIKSVHPRGKAIREALWYLQLAPRVTVSGSGDKEQKIELKVLGEVLKESDGVVDKRVIEHKVEGADAEKAKEAFKKAMEKLKDHGLSDEQRKKIHAAVEQAMKNHHKRMIFSLDAALEGQGGQKFMIGVECADVDDEMRKNSGAKEGVGIAVNSVFEDSPAATAGIQENDILIKVGDEDLKDAMQLIKAVQAAGKDDGKMSVTLLRGKDEKTLVVEPKERIALGIEEIGGLPGSWSRTIMEWPQKRMLMIGPGVVTDRPVAPAAKAQTEEIRQLKKQVDDLSKQVKRLQAALKKMQSDED